MRKQTIKVTTSATDEYVDPGYFKVLEMTGHQGSAVVVNRQAALELLAQLAAALAEEEK